MRLREWLGLRKDEGRTRHDASDITDDSLAIHGHIGLLAVCTIARSPVSPASRDSCKPISHIIVVHACRRFAASQSTIVRVILERRLIRLACASFNQPRPASFTPAPGSGETGTGAAEVERESVNSPPFDQSFIQSILPSNLLSRLSFSPPARTDDQDPDPGSDTASAASIASILPIIYDR